MIQAGNTEGISDIIRFVLEIDKLKGVLRKVKPTGEDPDENTAEHRWQIALFAFSLAQVVEISVAVNRRLRCFSCMISGRSMREINLSSRRMVGKTATLLSFAPSSEFVISPHLKWPIG
jgi:hypothetical protein